jgi:WD40 repeat protein
LPLLVCGRAAASLKLASPEPIVLKAPDILGGDRMSAGNDGRLAVRTAHAVWVWGPGPGKIEKTIESLSGAFVGLTPDGRFVATGGPFLSKDRMKGLAGVQAEVWDTVRDKKVDTIKGGDDAVISADGGKAALFLADEMGDDTVRLRDMKTGKVRVIWDGPGKCLETGSMFQPYQCEGIRSVSLSPDGSRLLLAREQKAGWQKQSAVLMIDAKGKKLRGYEDCDCGLTDQWEGANVTAWSGDGRTLAYGGRYGRNGPCGLIVREAQTGVLLWSSKDSVRSLAFSPDGSALVGVRSDKGPLLVWDAATGQAQTPPTQEAAGGAAFAADGSFLFVGLHDQAEILAYRLKGHAAPAAVAAAPAPKVEAVEDVDVVPAAKTKADPEALAVVIGIEHYRQKGIPAVDYAASDAKTVAGYLTGAMGFDSKNVILLTDEAATKTDLEKYLGPWLANRATAKSRVFIFYAGHGSPDPQSGDAFLMPYEGDPSYTQITGYPLKELYKTLAALPTKDVVVTLDSCFSGAGQRSLIAAGARPLVTVKSAAPAGSTMVLAAAAGDQISGSYPEGRHGLLTYFLLKGLRGAADADQDGDVTTRELYDYLRPAVEREARQRNYEQTPLLQGLPEGQTGPVLIRLK